MSAEMAPRIEQAFGVKMETLLGMQALADGHAMRERAESVHVERYVPTARSGGA